MFLYEQPLNLSEFFSHSQVKKSEASHAALSEVNIMVKPYLIISHAGWSECSKMVRPDIGARIWSVVLLARR